MAEQSYIAPRELRWKEWAEGRPSRTGRGGKLTYFYGGTWRTESGWKKFWKLSRERVRGEGKHVGLIRLRDDIFDLLGHKCARCGFSDERALQIDHINGGGKTDLKRFSSPTAYYKHVLEVGNREYQILCANCNQIKKRENHEYPRPRFI